jgi:uncharacterized protein (DUF1501 family)
MLLGGNVRGGRIVGQYPSDLRVSGPLVDGRGSVIPTTSWDAVWNGVLEWFGVDDLDYCLPNLDQTVTPTFPAFRREDLFETGSVITV